MDADTLRAILSAQAAAQAAAQEKMLQAVMKEMRGLFSTMASSPTTAHATSAEFVTNSLSARLPEFTHDPENGCTFDVWYSRYEDIITQDGATLDDAARARLIVSKLDAAAYARFTNHILPRRAAEIPLADTVKTLQELFGHNTSVFARRYAYLKTQCNGESLRDYTGLVNRRHEMAEFNAITAEQMKCLVWICGLAAPDIQYVKTSEFGQADALSRLIGSHSLEPEDRVIASIDADFSAEAATTGDRTLTLVIDCIRSGSWPKMNRDSPLWPFYNRRDSLSTADSCLLTSSRLVIPKSLQRRVLQSLHKAHPGQARMKMLARSYVYWPSMDTDIDTLVRNCTTCAQLAKNPVKVELQSWPKTVTPWARVHADFAGPLDGNFYLVIVDAFSKWPEIIQMNSITTSATIRVLTKVFAQFGNPQTLITDNGTQFTSTTFANFCRRRGIKHVRSPPFHPQSNGQAERFVDTFKRGYWKEGFMTVQKAVNNAIYEILTSHHIDIFNIDLMVKFL
ncbi:integrase core domain protein [Teladorsagia circumcincta]|uniref:RNA-directed DNA polymerase n=1 Tax=Teladorsagia circumcincta TaxID=45464 RepID=A0A2G9V203_TELCI|nr:integrase core domain protein [Teladorsagia circumcincta]